jgi:hypothetical protein
VLSRDLRRVDAGIALGVVGQHVVDAEPGQDVPGVGVPAERHPRAAPDGDERREAAAGPDRFGVGPGGEGVVVPAPLGCLQHVEEATQRRQRGRDVADVGDPDRHARGPQRGHVLGFVLLLVGHHKVRRSGGDSVDRRILRAAEARYVEVGGVRAPVRGADEGVPGDAVRRGDRLGE